MPQITLEYTANVIEKNDFPELFKQLHEILSTKLPAQLRSCKSRAVQQQNYYVGDGNPANAFVSVHLKIMSGRTPETLRIVAEEIMTVLQNHFSESLKTLNLEITLQLQELTTDKYFKVAS